MPQHQDATTHLFAVSDGSGQTARRMLQAVLAQFPDAPVEIRMVSGVRSVERVEAIVEEAAVVGALIAYTFVLEDLRRHMRECAACLEVQAVDLLDPLFPRLQKLLGRTPVGQPGLLETESLERAEAMIFAVKHDDGQRPQDLSQAEIVLVGASRTSKTPISVYLSYHGWRVANVPITLHAPPPRELFTLDRRRVIGLTIEAPRLQMLRRARVRQIGVQLPGYTDLSVIRQELMHVLELCYENDWRVVDVTNRSVEEAAAEIVSLIEPSPRFLL